MHTSVRRELLLALLLALLFVPLIGACSALGSSEEQRPPWSQFETSTVKDFASHRIETIAITIETQPEEQLIENYGKVPTVHPNIRKTLEAFLIQKGYQIVRREMMDQIMEEQVLSVSDLTQSSREVGNLLNVEAFLAVKLGPIQVGELEGSSQSFHSCDLSASLVSVETGESLFTTSGSLWYSYMGWFVEDRVSPDYYSSYLPLPLSSLPDASGELKWKGTLGGESADVKVVCDHLATGAAGGRVCRIELSPSESATLFPGLASPVRSIDLRAEDDRWLFDQQDLGLEVTAHTEDGALAGTCHLRSEWVSWPMRYTGTLTIGERTLTISMRP